MVRLHSRSRCCKLRFQRDRETASATVQGQSVTILTNAQGLTLYYFKPDTATTSACTGGWAPFWPPPLFTGSGPPTPPTPPSGTLAPVLSGHGKPGWDDRNPPFNPSCGNPP